MNINILISYLKANNRIKKRASAMYKIAFSDNYDETKLQLFSIGKMNIKCKYCKALHFKSENFSMCCQSGKVTHV